MFKIAIDDGFCEYTFTLNHKDPQKTDGNSIQEIIHIITKNTDLVVTSRERTKVYGLMEMVENSLSSLEPPKELKE